MTVKGWRAVIIREETYDKLRAVYETYAQGRRSERKKVSFTSWLDEYLFEDIEDYELLQRYAPALEHIANTDNTVIIKDYLKDTLAEVEVRADEKNLYCRACERDDCLHVGFCFAIKEVNKILIEKGFKKPKKIE